MEKLCQDASDHHRSLTILRTVGVCELIFNWAFSILTLFEPHVFSLASIFNDLYFRGFQELACPTLIL